MDTKMVNNLNPTVVSPGESIECFEDISWEKKIQIQQGGAFQYLCIVKNAQLDMKIEIQSGEVQGKISFLIPTGEKNTTIHLVNEIQHSEVELEIELISLQKDKTPLLIDGAIKVAPHVQKVKANLMEEVYLLWDEIKTEVKPALFIDSHEVKTSHGTKIQRIPKESLFYLQSRGLNHQRAEEFFMENVVMSVLTPFSLSDEEKNQIFTFL